MELGQFQVVSLSGHNLCPFINAFFSNSIFSCKKGGNVNKHQISADRGMQLSWLLKRKDKKPKPKRSGDDEDLNELGDIVANMKKLAKEQNKELSTQIKTVDKLNLQATKETHEMDKVKTRIGKVKS